MQRQSRARRTVLWGLVSFVTVQLGLAGVIAWGPWVFLRDPAYGYKAVLLQRRLGGKDHPFTLVVLGSSRSMWSIDTATLEPLLAEELQCPVVAFNLAHNARGPASHELYLRRMLRQGMRPNMLLVEIHPGFLGGQAPQMDLTENWMPANWLWWEDLSLVKTYAGPQRHGVRRSWGEAWALPAFGHRLTLQNYLAPQLLPDGFSFPTFEQFDASGVLRGQRSHYTPTDAQRREARNIAYQQYKDRLQGFRLGAAQCQALRQIAALCRQEGITAIWLVPPEGPAFRSWYPPGAREQVLQFVRSLAAEFTYPVIDATDWLREEDFWDSVHLIPPANPRYTERLGREGLLPLLSRRLASRGSGAAAH